ncbi:MAG: protein kinase domain-containing protein [Pyrinomonadaceae bacterium]
MAELKLQQSRLDGRYDILECLGRGSYAEIYVAKDNAAAEGAPGTVVIKALNIFLQETPDAELERTLVANFQNEAVALDRVRHPHVINRLGHGTAIDLARTTFHYIVLEYLSGGDMAALSRNHPVSIEKMLFYLEQVCSGLAHAHQCGVIHRDIKPQNLLLTADKQIVKIADFGVARFEATEGAITRVGTNIYSAPEHNPLVQTAQLDSGSLVSSRELLTPAADIYSLAKTIYSLIAGEAPRRYAHHPITALPEAISSHYWSTSLLRVLQKATQTRAESRYQSVQAFWDDLADSVLPPTQPLSVENGSSRRKPSSELTLDSEELTQAPPRPRFEVAPLATETAYAGGMGPANRARIVVPVTRMQELPEGPATLAKRKSAREIVVAFPDQSRNGKSRARPPQSVSSGRTKRLLVALLLVISFSGMLLATHKYVTSRWNPLAGIPQLREMFVVGREGFTTTDVNLRADPSAANVPIGIAENGSRVKVLTVDNNWYEVQVIEHGRAKGDPFSSDRGWINKRFVRFD